MEFLKRKNGFGLKFEFFKNVYSHFAVTRPFICLLYGINKGTCDYSSRYLLSTIFR